MAVLRSYYWLCALPGDVGGVGGSSPGSLGAAAEPKGGLLTLGPHLLARYTFSDQKQVGGWASRDLITAPAVFDRSEKSYICVFNEYSIKIWKSTVENLDKVKKIKFNQPVVKLISDVDNSTVLVFKDGSCASLSYAKLAKKNLEAVSILEKDEVITSAEIYKATDEKFVCYLTKTCGQYCIIACQLNTDIHTVMPETARRIYAKRPDLPNAKVIGITISAKADVPQVHIMWSDGRLFAIDLVKGESNLVGHVPYVNNDVEVSLVWIGDNHIAMYGADLAQEGAVLIVFNVLFGVVTYRYPLKLYCAGARVWCLPDNLILESNQHLAVVPYVLSSHRNVLSLIGSSRKDKELDIISNVDWGKGKILWNLKEQWNSFAKKGVSERDTCMELFPPLMKNDNIKGIKKALNEFTDIPENLIVDLLLYTMTKFHIKYENSSEELIEIFSKNSDFRDLINSILDISFVLDSMIPYLRNNFSIEYTIMLLIYLNYLLCDQTEDTNFTLKYEEKLLLWSSCLIDSHFQEILLSNDDKCLKVLETLESTVEELINEVGSVESVLPALNSLNSTGLDTNINIDGMLYYIEEIKLY
ncbi:nucleolar protein 11 [Arctopsyche grandis]|uniref:nucleolar protein 11 n=1 Tax=Arctopsyche grandis TaxID=121162 RepID=UPI00406D73E4